MKRKNIYKIERIYQDIKIIIEIKIFLNKIKNFKIQKENINRQSGIKLNIFKIRSRLKTASKMDLIFKKRIQGKEIKFKR